jgi:hypothetical protein
MKVGASLATSRPGVFAAGDAVSGPASVIEAVAQGNRVAREVEVYLRTGRQAKIRIPLEAHLPPLTWDLEAHCATPRVRMPALPVAARRGSFREVELPVAESDIRTECRRCLRCDLEWSRQRKPVQATAMEAAQPLPV